MKIDVPVADAAGVQPVARVRHLQRDGHGLCWQQLLMLAFDERVAGDTFEAWWAADCRGAVKQLERHSERGLLPGAKCANHRVVPACEAPHYPLAPRVPVRELSAGPLLDSHRRAELDRLDCVDGPFPTHHHRARTSPELDVAHCNGARVEEGGSRIRRQ
eukprot:4400736-Prymnesium_polylepis.2